ncbi:hypothetical protein BCT23_05955 [Enterovibrio norvegicus]|uniref:DUF333 domain-containing protein n=1 Tax=Enterovibrio norvegicus TaxID=188144 RepID=A0A2N7L5W7_9GAMM|nr:hypothetical protein BCT23_05955 [Enterovibrio norvegicus]
MKKFMALFSILALSLSINFSAHANNGSGGSATQMGPLVTCTYSDGSTNYVPSMMCTYENGTFVRN